ncbi:MAG: TerB family tellurite resistance protein [Hymenobacteraceae bacterium]|nr:TerB family tellurite resistance protein [Hymenobacteraceae bacterium]
MNTRTTRDLLDSRQKRLYFFQNLLLVATADGYLDEQEGDFLLQVGDQLELTPEDVAPLIENLRLLTFIIPETGIERTFELQTLVMMMMEDGKVDEREYALCLEYATRIGYGRAFLDDLIQKFATLT